MARRDGPVNGRARRERLLNWLAAHYTVALWFLLTGDLIYAVEISPLDESAQEAISAVILLFGGYEVILDQLNNRLLTRANANLRRKIDDANRKVDDANKKVDDANKKSEADAQEKTELRRQVEDANKKSEANAQENAELRRRIAELEQQRNGNGAK